ncbi:MAG: radical SAM protein [Acidimicrobiales bacterium]|nr:radical SAM protein [Acidimicrobiales bacterium]
MDALVVSTYDLGRFPVEAWAAVRELAAAGWSARLCDVSLDPFDEAAAAQADLVLWSLPMHTATRLALPLIDAVAARSPRTRQGAFGLYAVLNEELLAARGVQPWVGSVARAAGAPGSSVPSVPPALDRYAQLVLPDGSRRVVGAVAASSGCRHRCRHCPVVPVFDGRFRPSPVDAVLADVAALVERGAAHLTFTDADFLNGPAHAARVVDAVHGAFPSLSFDLTARIDHLLAAGELLGRFAVAGCVLVTSAVESFDDATLAWLGKDHRAADVAGAVAACRAAGIAFNPTFVPFTPWTTPASYAALFDAVAALGLESVVPPVQYCIRLLVTARSRLLDLPEVRAVAGPYDAAELSHPWRHPDPAVDALAVRALEVVRRHAGVDESPSGRAAHHRVVHTQLRDLARAAAGSGPGAAPGAVAQPAAVPYLTEPWFC